MTPTQSEIPAGFCQCGCGQRTPISRLTETRRGAIKGQPRRFVYGHAKRKVAPELRFWDKVKIGQPDECWEWQASKYRNGYGVFNAPPITRLAHRFAYHTTYGLIPRGMVICHHCDNPACCNPAHLFLGTSHDNAQDCIVKGRAKRGDRRGERSGRAVVTADQVPLIRNEALAGLSHRTLARKYGLSKTQIGRIVRGESWQHIT